MQALQVPTTAVTGQVDQEATPGYSAHVIAMRSGPPLAQRIEIAISTIERLIEDGHGLVMTLSAGKDSSSTTLLCLEAIRRSVVRGVNQAMHFVSSSSTSVENPEVEDMLLTAHEDIARWTELHKLPVDVRLVHPNDASKFVVSVIGRGTLPRFVENGSKRSCATDWKVKPQQRLAKSISEKVLAAGFKETVTVLGSRLDESTTRNGSMTKRGDQAQKPNRNPSGFLTLSLIADWTESDVWEFLIMFLDGQIAPFPAYAQGETVRRMLDLYRDGNEGTCGMFMADGKKAPCGSRFGCWTCTITGDRDKSMDSMLNSDEKYSYLRGLNAFRNFLIATQWDMGRRELVGRSISSAGFVPVRPDVYNMAMRTDLLKFALTLDELEVERAEQVEADVVSGRLPKSPENTRMSNPQFQIVSDSDIVLIDFFWSLHHGAYSAFPAMEIWYQVKTLGRRYAIPAIEKVPKMAGIPQVRWYQVDAFDRDVPTDGLRDYKAEMWNAYRHPERLITHREVSGKRVVWHENAETLSVNATEAVLFGITYCTTNMPMATQFYTPLESARFWLNEGIVKLPAGMVGRYQHMAKRAQYFTHLAERLNVTPAELDKYLIQESISDEAHAEIVGNAPEATEDQFSLFEL
ncbi:phosphoadenosine phosphosulfate reductase domain-containing protein [Polaromonas aquatica]|uniref:Phosphoadenosine phosphosulfate reductase family protein n=1 Tax=Polaromonas aquatica TaxID=332657 RepID=A0ABW1TU74_9BURK